MPKGQPQEIPMPSTSDVTVEDLLARYTPKARTAKSGKKREPSAGARLVEAFVSDGVVARNCTYANVEDATRARLSVTQYLAKANADKPVTEQIWCSPRRENTFSLVNLALHNDVDQKAGIVALIEKEQKRVAAREETMALGKKK